MIELKAWYRDRLPARIAALEEVKDQLKERIPHSVVAIRRIAHSLRNSGSTYGFPEITLSAQLLEEAREEDLLGCTEGLIKMLHSVCAGPWTAKSRILVIEDDEDQAQFIVGTLASADREILEARTAEQAQEILDREEVSLILLDLILPDTDGRNFLSRLRERFSTATVPVIVLTVKRAFEAKAECFALGADDFIEKPVKAEALGEAVSTRLKKGPDPARALARDPLTGLANRAAFHEAFHRQSATVPTPGEGAAAMIVLDGFEPLAQKHGTKTADAIVRHAARVFSRSLRGTDLLARFTGCEFTVLFPHTPPPSAAIALKNALETLKGCPYAENRKVPLELSFSAGIAPLGAGRSLEEVLSEVDRHLHLAQEQGGARVVFSLDQQASPRRKILVLDDDELIRMVLERHLQREGYEVLPYGDGQSALQAAQEHSLSLVITDGSMPAMDGFEFVTRLRGIPDYATVPVVMLTSMGEERDIVRGFEVGVDDYVVKPFSAGELLARIRRLLKRSPSRA